MTEHDAILAGIVSDPLEETRWLVLADWLEEFDDPRRAELLRLHRKLLATCCEPDAHPDRSVWQPRIVELLAAGARPCVPRKELVLPGGVPMTLAFVPPGRFRMGSDHPDGFDDERPVHAVTLTKGFYLGVHSVTQAQWRAVMGTEPSEFKGENRPVETVSWDECQAFCKKVTADLSGGGRVELPTEAEWEWACRAGTTSEYHYGDVITADLLNYDGEHCWNGSPVGTFRGETTDVGAFPANAWGLCDLHGNVWEWCADRFVEYATGDQTDPGHETEESDDSYRVLRGGSWDSYPVGCRAACRNWYVPACRDYFVGFRVRFRLD